MLQFRLTTMDKFFKKMHIFDNVDEIRNRYQFNNIVHNVLDNYTLHNQELR